MKTTDYLHSALLSEKKNNDVFNKTYHLIENLAKKTTKIECIAFNIKDQKTISELQQINATWISDEIIELVNYTIENFNKNHKL